MRARCLPIDTVTTSVSDDSWTDLTAIWAAATPAAVEGEVIVVQPSEQEIGHAIVVVQAATPPAATRRGHLVTAGRKLRATVASGRKHYARAYMESAAVIATGEGVV